MKDHILPALSALVAAGFRRPTIEICEEARLVTNADPIYRIRIQAWHGKEERCRSWTVEELVQAEAIRKYRGKDYLVTRLDVLVGKMTRVGFTEGDIARGGKGKST